MVDATRKLNQFGCYINHTRHGINIKPHPPLLGREKYRVGFYSLKDIQKGEELFYDYNDSDADHLWLKTVIVDGLPQVRPPKASKGKTPKVGKGKTQKACKGKGKACPKPKPRRNYRMCPISYCLIYTFYQRLQCGCISRFESAAAWPTASTHPQPLMQYVGS